MKTLLFTHVADCDGVTPSILLKIARDNVDTVFLDNGEVNEGITKLLLDGTLSNYDEIYICDISPNISTIELLITAGLSKKLKIFDHHKSSLYANKYEFASIIIDLNGIKQSATSLFYSYIVKIHKELDTPAINQFVEYVRAYDTWDWQNTDMQNSKNLSNLFAIYGLFYFEQYYIKKLPKMKNFEYSDDENLLLEIEKTRIQNYINEKNNELFSASLFGYKMGIVFADRHRSELGNTLAFLHKDLDIIAMIDMSRSISFRCIKNINANEVAEKLGGGGHAKSCGATIKDNEKLDVINLLFKNNLSNLIKYNIGD